MQEVMSSAADGPPMVVSGTKLVTTVLCRTPFPHPRFLFLFSIILVWVSDFEAACTLNSTHMHAHIHTNYLRRRSHLKMMARAVEAARDRAFKTRSRHFNNGDRWSHLRFSCVSHPRIFREVSHCVGSVSKFQCRYGRSTFTMLARLRVLRCSVSVFTPSCTCPCLPSSPTHHSTPMHGHTATTVQTGIL